MAFIPVWSQRLAAPLLGLALAREPLHVLAWDASPRLTLWNRLGRVLGTHALVHAPVAAAMSDDGATAVVACQDGTLWWFDDALRLRFDQRWDAEPAAVALEPQGYVAAVSDARGRLTLVDSKGERGRSWETPRPLAHLAFLPFEAGLVGAAIYGFVAAYDAEGKCLWRDGPLTHVNGLQVDGAGERVVLACYSAGVQRYRWRDGRRSQIPTPDLCRLVAIDFAGETLLVAHESPSLALLASDGRVRDVHDLPEPAVAVALGALGDVGVFGLASGEATFFHLGEAS